MSGARERLSTVTPISSSPCGSPTPPTRSRLARFRAADLRVTRKPDRTPVTDADTAAEDALRALIAAERPATRCSARSAAAP